MVDINQALLSGIFGGGSGGGAAGDITDITNFGNSIAANDYWKMAANPILQTQFDRSSWSPMTSLGVSAGQSFLGALLHGIGQRDEAAQLQSVASILPQLYSDPSSVMAPEGVDAEAFGKLKLATMTRNQIARAAAQSQNAKLMQDLFGSGIKAKLEAAGKVEGEASARKGLGQSDPETLKNGDTLRKELLGLDEIKNFGEVKTKVQVLQKAFEDPSSVADLDFVYAVAKILDPNSVVRESEGQTIIDSQSIPAATLGYLNKQAKGESALDRKALYDLAIRHFDTRKQTVGSIFDKYSDLAQKRGVDPNEILPFGRDVLNLDTSVKIPFDANSAKKDILSLAQSGMSKEQIKSAIAQKYSIPNVVQ